MRAWLIVVALVLAGCGASAEKARETLQSAANCNAAAQACEAKGAGGALTFSVANARTMQPTTLYAKWQGAPAESVLVNFNMVDMDMGENRYRLLPDSQGGWTGKAVLPVCMQGRSDWVADVKVTVKEGGAYYARFVFTVTP